MNRKRTIADLIEEYTTYAEDGPPDNNPELWEEADFAVRDTYIDIIRDLKEIL
jgi:hypothetical protein